MKILKFGGKSLANGKGIKRVFEIIQNHHQEKNKFAVIVSARGNTTDDILAIIDTILKGEDYSSKLAAFKKTQLGDSDINLEKEFHDFEYLLEGVELLQECSEKTKDRLLSFGELISSRWIAHELNAQGINAVSIDAGDLFKTDSDFGQANVNLDLSEKLTQTRFAEINDDTVAIVTGFIASNDKNERTTLGRNGSNYSAALLANFTNASVLKNYTHVDGIFTANPDTEEEARKIAELSYTEAAELAQFGASILHAKTMEPLTTKNISLRILNTFGKDDQTGTLISAKPKSTRVRALASLGGRALIRFEGKGLLGKVGVDARIFSVFQKEQISVGLISQSSSERGIGMVVDQDDAEKAVRALKTEFAQDILSNDVDSIVAEKNLAVLAIIGLSLNQFDKPYRALVKNQITPILFNNTITGSTICLLITEEEKEKATHVIHGELFEQPKKVHIAVAGHGVVGKTFINQVLKQNQTILEKKNIDLRIFAVANSSKLLLKKEGISSDWESEKEALAPTDSILNKIQDFAKKEHLENLIFVDNTANKDIASEYINFVHSGFDLISSNKIANTLSLDNYYTLRKALKNNNKEYLYETNVGAGLPLIDTIKILHLSGENITRITGIFSGSLSYLFNNYSVKEAPFSEILLEAKERGYTEPDPREDLCGNDVARKLLILARELGFDSELSDVKIQNLIPENLQSVNQEDFFKRINEMNPIYQEIKDNAGDNVLRYVGDLQWDLDNNTGTLEVKLIETAQDSDLGQVKGADSIFEIYTESYGDQPLVIKGAGAGADVTARGVFGDVLRLAVSLDN